MTRSRAVYFLSDATSTLGNSIVAVVWPVLVLQTTGSPLAAGLVAACGTIPAIIAGLAGGVVVDRFNRVRVSIGADLVSAASVAALPMLDSLGIDPSVVVFALLAAVGAFGDLPGMSAREAILPNLVGVEGTALERAVAVREGLQTLAFVIGPAVAGGLLVLLPGTLVMWIPAGLSFLAACVSMAIPMAVGHVDEGTSSVSSVGAAMRSAGEGFALLRRDAMLRALLTVGAAAVIVVGTLAALLLPIHFARLDRPGQLGVVLTVLALGGLVGSAAIAAIGPRGTARGWYLAGMIGAGVSVGVIALLPPWWLIVGSAAVAGAASGAVNAVVGAAYLRRIPDDMRGRLSGAQNTLMIAAVTPGLVVFGAIAEVAGLRTAGVVLVVLWIGSVAWAMWTPALRILGQGSETEAARC